MPRVPWLRQWIARVRKGVRPERVPPRSDHRCFVRRPCLEVLEDRLAPAVTTLASFNGTNGATPTSLVRDSSGDLFGATGAGGAKNDGTVFEVAAGSNTITTLASFNGTNGAAPNAGVIMDNSGDLFGTTTSGGASNDGTVFEVAAGSNTITTLASFNGTLGKSPDAGVIMDNSGDLFGITEFGGVNNNGTVFEVAAGSNIITNLATILFSFDGTNGITPSA
jgi:uncharacterized repeat protein (TIGR03803 family)